MKTPISVKKILASEEPNLQRLISKAGHLNKLNSRLAQLLPSQLAQHCKIATAEQGRLVILVTSSAWATRLRLQQTTILKAFQNINIDNLTILIAPEAIVGGVEKPQKRRRTISPETSKLLIDLAEATTDPKLKSALRRLSQHSRK